MLSATVFVNRTGLRWRDAPSAYGPHKTLYDRTKGGMNTNLHAIADANRRPLSFFLIAGQVSDYTGAAALFDDLPNAQRLLGGRGYDADWF